MNKYDYITLRELVQNINFELHSYVSAKNNVDSVMESLRRCVCDPASMCFLDKYYTHEKVLVDNIELFAREYIKFLIIVANELEFDAHMESWIPYDISY